MVLCTRLQWNNEKEFHRFFKYKFNCTNMWNGDFKSNGYEFHILFYGFFIQIRNVGCELCKMINYFRVLDLIIKPIYKWSFLCNIYNGIVFYWLNARVKLIASWAYISKYFWIVDNMWHAQYEVFFWSYRLIWWLFTFYSNLSILTIFHVSPMSTSCSVRFVAYLNTKS